MLDEFSTKILRNKGLDVVLSLSLYMNYIYI